MFSIPQDGAADRSSDRWKTFQGRISKEVSGIKWKASMPDLVAKIGELFDIEIPSLFLISWRKAIEIRAALDESRRTPDQVSYVGLAEHTASSEHHPYIDVRIENATVKKIEFTVRVSFKLNGFVLKIQQGVIKEIITGTCQAQGTIEFEGLTLAEKKLEPVTLPGSIPVNENGNRGN
jgi:hypothetical protein